jgi:hypothetical protein
MGGLAPPGMFLGSALLRRVLRTPFAAVVLVIADQFFLFSVDGKYRIALRQVFLSLLGNV